jgi:hypothetical protein
MKLLHSLFLSLFLALPGLPAAAQESKTAREQLKESLAKAKEGKKRVLLTFGGAG